MKAIKDEIRLIDAYKEYLKRYKEYKEILSKKIFGRKKYEKDNTDLVERYREIYNKIVELHPDKTIPARITLEKKLVKLECEYNEIYKQYRNNEILFRALMKKGYSGNKKSKPLNGTCPELELTLF